MNQETKEGDSNEAQNPSSTFHTQYNDEACSHAIPDVGYWGCCRNIYDLDHTKSGVQTVKMASLFSCGFLYWDQGSILSTEQGTLVWPLRNKIGIEMTVDLGFRIVDCHNNIVIAASATKESCLLLHDNGCVYARADGTIDVTCYDLRNKNDKYSRMYPERKVITFISREGKLGYRVSEGNISTIRQFANSFSPIYSDFSYDLLRQQSTFGSNFKNDAMAMLDYFVYRICHYHTQVWKSAAYQMAIKFSADRFLSVEAPGMKVVLQYRTGNVQLQFSGLNISASKGENPHLYVRTGEMRLFYNGIDFITRNGGQAVGFNRFGQMQRFTRD